MKKRLIVVMTALLILTVLMAGCTRRETATGSGTAARGRTHLNVVIMNLPVSMHPTGSNDAFSSVVNTHIYNRLVELDREKNEIVPSLATSWEFIDLQTINFRLREGVTFHNGARFSARDVKFSLENAAKAPQAGIVLGMIESVTINNDYNVTIHLSRPFSPIVLHLAHSLASIAPYGSTVEQMEAHPIGTNFYKFGGLVIGDRVNLVRNENFWGTKPAIETITIRLVPESAGRLLAVETGEADIALDLGAPEVGSAARFTNVNLMRAPGLRTTYIAFNTQKAPFNNRLVRQAISYAIPKVQIIEAVFMGVSVPAIGPLAPGVFGYTPLQPSEFNVNRARELMAQAGFANGFNARIWYNVPDQQRLDIAEIIQNNLRAININVTVEGLELASYLGRAQAGEHDMMIMGWTTITGDADYGLYPLFHSESIGINNYSFWSTPELDRLLERGRAETDVDVRLEIYRQAQEIIREGMPWIFMYHDEWLIATSRDLRGFFVDPARNHNFGKVWFE